MAKKLTAWRTKGMNRDLSVSAFNPEFAFENRNLRLSTNESNTMMSWVNERGTSQISLRNVEYWSKREPNSDFIKIVYTDPNDSSWTHHEANTEDYPIIGTTIGTAVINHQLVIFSTDTLHGLDYIFLLSYIDSDKESMYCKMLFGMENTSLGFDVEHPIETQVSYESETIQKVYWTDGINQPRVINIKGNIRSANTTQFDFVPTLQLQEEVHVKKLLGASGTFAPGVIQYAFTYYTKYGQESNIFYTTPLQYISYRDRGASPEDKVDNAFKITVKNVDTNFDYLRIYSIQRTSINATPICKRIQDISITDLSVKTYVYYTVSSKKITNNGVDVSGYPSNYITKSFLGGSHRWYCYYKSTYPNLKIAGSGGYITWGPNSSSTSAICVSADSFTPSGSSASGYQIIELPNITSATLESLSFIPTTSSGTDTATATYIDTGTSGDSIDPTELLYKGGEVISALTMEQKDNTLFLGNLAITRNQISKELRDDLKDNIAIEQDKRVITSTLTSTGSYAYSNQLTSYNSDKSMSVPCAGFKHGDTYRLGVQFQHITGKWSDPVWVGDKLIENIPEISISGNESVITLPTFKGTLSTSQVYILINSGYRRVRGCVVFPQMQDRNILCQGVVNPTLYTEKHRNTDYDLYAQSSWFFRPSGGRNKNADGTVAPVSDGTLAYTHRGISNGVPETGCTNYNPSESTNNIRFVEVQGDYADNNKFKIDKNDTVTFHSPDVEFDTQLSLVDYSSTKFRQAGYVRFSSTMSDIDIQTETPTVSSIGGGFVHKSFRESYSFGIVAGLFYEDFLTEEVVTDETNTITRFTQENSPVKFMVYPWNRTGSLNNDIIRPANTGIQSAVLKKKTISNLRFAGSTTYNTEYPECSFYDNSYPRLFSGDGLSILKLNNNIYKGNIDTAIIPDYMDGDYFAITDSADNMSGRNIQTDFTSNSWWKTFSKSATEANDEGAYKYKSSGWIGPSDIRPYYIGGEYLDLVLKKTQVRMKYKSTPHLAFRHSNNISWDSYSYMLPIVEILQSPTSQFGGESLDALKENIWLPAGEPKLLTDVDTAGQVAFEWSYGDTYFQRWDCLKTYAFTPEDTNQIVEIGSFMLETRVNIDGRYDRNRGQMNNLNMSPKNFNLLNPVYSQKDNFFQYRIQDNYYYNNNKFPNQLTWSKTKTNGADVDLWTNTTLASTLEMDGNKGEITSINRLNDQLICFQNSGISQILYNENVQIQSTAGVPIEIANSGKVQGKRYFSDTIGCSNKWSIQTGAGGLYFMDSDGKGIYVFNGQLSNISVTSGFNAWSKTHIPSNEVKWNPLFPETNEQSAFVTYYDRMNQEMMFINNIYCLNYSEKFKLFTSFYDYQNTPYFCNLDDTGIWIRANQLWKHQAGDYCQFFGAPRPYSMVLIGNPEPHLDKIFTNIEFRACVEDDGVWDNDVFTPYLPFDSLDTWNEYQHGISNLMNRNGHLAMQHHASDNNAALKRRLRIWRCDIPRDNGEGYDTFDETFDDTFHPISRDRKHPIDRMRNPWLYLRLRKAPDSVDEPLRKVEIHDIIMSYFI